MGAEAYKTRKRYLYALFFKHGACYIGQSVNPTKRLIQHHSSKGLWNCEFEMVVLHEIHGTKTDGEHYEQAYRLKAKRKGYRIYGLPHVYVDPRKRATLFQWWDSFFLPWPKGHRVRWWRF